MKPRQDKIVDLLSEKFYPHLKAEVNNKDILYIIPFLPELKLNNVNEEDIQKIIKEFETYKSKLMQKTDEEINASWSEMQEVKEIKNQEFLKECELQKQRREQNLFFNRQNANADYDYWSKIPFYNQDEAVALLLGKCPKIVNWGNIEYQVRNYPFASEYAQLREIINRALDSGDLKQSTGPYPDFSLQIKPSDLIEWANSRGIEVPIEFKEKVMHGFQDWKSLYEEQRTEFESLQEQVRSLTKELEEAKSSLHGKEKDSMLKMIAVLAVFCGYTPEKKRNEAVAKICALAKDRNISICEGTVRGFLKLAVFNHLRLPYTENS